MRQFAGKSLDGTALAARTEGKALRLRLTPSRAVLEVSFGGDWLLAGAWHRSDGKRALAATWEELGRWRGRGRLEVMGDARLLRSMSCRGTAAKTETARSRRKEAA